MSESNARRPQTGPSISWDRARVLNSMRTKELHSQVDGLRLDCIKNIFDIQRKQGEIIRKYGEHLHGAKGLSRSPLLSRSASRIATEPGGTSVKHLPSIGSPKYGSPKVDRRVSSPALSTEERVRRRLLGEHGSDASSPRSGRVGDPRFTKSHEILPPRNSSMDRLLADPSDDSEHNRRRKRSNTFSGVVDNLEAEASGTKAEAGSLPDPLPLHKQVANLRASDSPAPGSPSLTLQRKHTSLADLVGCERTSPPRSPALLPRSYTPDEPLAHRNPKSYGGAQVKDCPCVICVMEKNKNFIGKKRHTEVALDKNRTRKVAVDGESMDDSFARELEKLKDCRYLRMRTSTH
ncbi:PREDICTED: uncharacterized protein LOC109475305 [Branchiostoma belcheri]|uniref:Uncharacterized protein LOC109475305 n=1 Tax=Branchiostoma belcheri TaxID=7741 RepID=A0A6P4ZC46_BRABE|nr:PREDICTED: uncharacterized protein LOC109475305 [Branchiostoma belcheri]